MEEHTLLSMKTDLFPTTITKHHVPITDELRSKVLEIYNSQKFNTPKPFVLGPTEDVQELVKYYSDSIEEFLEEVEPNGKAQLPTYLWLYLALAISFLEIVIFLVSIRQSIT